MSNYNKNYDDRSSRGSRDSGGRGGYRGGRGGYDRDGGDRNSNNSYRGGRGGYPREEGSFRGRGGRPPFRGRGDSNGGQDSQVIERFEADNMFEVIVPGAVDPSENVIIPQCGQRFGDFGTHISLSSNYIRVKSLPNHTIYQYHVTFDPDISSMRLRQGLLRSEKEIIKTVCAFDGNILYLPYKIDDIQKVLKTRQDNDVTMAIKFTNTVSVGSPASASIFNIIVRRVMSMLDMKQIKRHYYDPKESKLVEGCGLEVWPGFAGSLVYMNNAPLYNLDVVNHVMRRESAYDFMMEEVQHARMSKEDIEKKLVGQIVMTRYNNRTYRIDSIDWDRKPSSEFELKNGEKISYADYYRKQYNISLVDLNQPLLASIMKERRTKHEDKLAQQKGETRLPVENIVHLIPELSYLTGITEDLRANFSTMKELSRFTKLGPTGRCNGVFNFLKRVDTSVTATDYLSNWGVELDKHLVSIPARQYPPEKIIFSQHDEGYTYNPREADWTSALRNIKLFNPGRISNWVLFCTRRDRDLTDQYLGTLLQCCRALGFAVSDPEIVEIANANGSELYKSMKVLDRQNYEMAMFVLPPNRKELYNAAKTVCCIDRPIPSQVVTTKTISRQNVLKNVCTKIGIQMSAKIGGEPWLVNIPSKYKMIVGIDVCHEAGGSRGNSWLGFTASLNDNQTRYFSRATRQPNRTEIADSLGMNMKMALEQYYKLNQRMPDAIIVYRDGVGDGQLEVVRIHEMPSLQASLEEVCRSHGPVPALAYIIVRKRISTRLFSVGDTQATNPLPGSIVDRVVTKDEYPNFYLVSQTVREGSVNPTHFIVIFNSTRLNTNNLQRLSYKTCHLYFNWSGTVRVPAPCQYAHKLCFLVSQSLGKEPSSVLSDRLYYL